jgi:tRNA pseudouridine13 synthase
LKVPRLDREIGIEVYTTDAQGIGGAIRQFPEDFRVEEVLKDYSKAQIAPAAIRQINDRGRYLICVLVKRNMDTFLAIQKIAEKLGVDQERIQIAGIKDARALTAQHVSIGRMLPEQVTHVKFGNPWLYPLRFSNEKIHSNLLFGNQFRIILRAINCSLSRISERMEDVRKELLELGDSTNFFGHQRFGTTRPITHLVGKHILLGEWEKAALTFLAKPSSHEHPESRQAREGLWNTEDYEEALRYFPPKLVYEREMLNHLAKRPRDFLGAFYRLPKKLRQLFVQAYQSYLFNKFLSQRIQRGLPLKQAHREEYKLAIDGKKCLAIPLIGYKQSVSMGEQGEIENEILTNEEVTPQHFMIAAMPQISSPGGLRTALTPLIGLRIEDPTKDDANPKRKMVSLGFTLRKGSYATIILREFMKPSSPIRAGF